MRRQARAFEGAWRRLAMGVPLDRPALARARARGVVPDLELAVALRTVATAVAIPDAEASWADLQPRLEARPLPRTARPAAHSPARSRRLRVTAALTAAASVGVFTVASLRAGPGSLLYPVRKAMERAALALSPADGGIALSIAEARLQDLLSSLGEGEYDLAPGLARDLMGARRDAIDAGAAVLRLDRQIRRQLPPALASAPPGIQQIVRSVVGLPPPEDDTGTVPVGGGDGGGSPGPGEDEGGAPGPGQDDGGSGDGPADEGDQGGGSNGDPEGDEPDDSKGDGGRGGHGPDEHAADHATESGKKGQTGKGQGGGGG